MIIKSIEGNLGVVGSLMGVGWAILAFSYGELVSYIGISQEGSTAFIRRILDLVIIAGGTGIMVYIVRDSISALVLSLIAFAITFSVLMFVSRIG